MISLNIFSLSIFSAIPLVYILCFTLDSFCFYVFKFTQFLLGRIMSNMLLILSIIFHIRHGNFHIQMFNLGLLKNLHGFSSYAQSFHQLFEVQNIVMIPVLMFSTNSIIYGSTGSVSSDVCISSFWVAFSSFIAYLIHFY